MSEADMRAKVIPVRRSRVTRSYLRFMSETITEVESQVITEVAHESHVYVHVTYPPGQGEMLLRIWRTTFLFDKGSSHESRLVHADNISYAPTWTIVPAGRAHTFLLIFEGLPKECTVFDLVEKIDQPGAFEIRSIRRNKSDVYRVTLDP